MPSKILIVDDEPDLSRLIAYALQVEGYQTITAISGSEGLSKVQVELPDLVILDLMLPDISGIEVCKQLRGNPATSDLPIIILSARVQVADKVRSLQAGADEYISKPVDSDELVARVRAILKFTDRLRRAAPPPKKGKVWGFLGAKGGVGTTTVALNVAALLAQQKKSVIAAEVRPSLGSFSLEIKHPASKNLGGLLKLDPAQINEREMGAWLANTQFGLRVLFGPQSPSEFGVVEPAQAETIVDQLSRMAEITILDLPAEPSEANHAIIGCCSLLVLVVEPEPLSVAFGKIALERLGLWNVPASMVSAVVLTRAPLSMPLSLSDISTQLGCTLTGIIQPAADACMAAHSRGVPLAIAKPDHMAVSSMLEIANRLANGTGPVVRG